MDLRRFTMTNPTVLFSSIAHEAWGHKITDEEENENDEHQIDEHNASIRARRRFRRDFNTLPEKVLLAVFSYLPHIELLRCARVCRLWRSLSQNSKLWKTVFLRPEYHGLHVKNSEQFLNLIAHRFSTSLQFIELPMELITADILHELANKCPNLKYLTLDFSTAMQLHDFYDLNAFPCNLKMICICLSEVIFLEGFMRRIYTYLSSLEVLQIIGTIEKSNEAEEEIYETINISKIKAQTPNLRVINLYGIFFVDDNHIEIIASGCIHLECLALNFCTRVKGTSFKNLLQRCRKLQCLLLQNTGIEDTPMLTADWGSSCVNELDISSTDLTENCLLAIFERMPKLTYLAVPNCDGFTDKVLALLIELGKLTNIRAIDLSNTVNLNYEVVFTLLKLHGRQLRGICYAGNSKVTEQFWINTIKYMRNIKILVIGTPHGWFKKINTRIHIDQILEACAQECQKLERLEIQWDEETLRWNENSSKFIDHIRIRCVKLHSLVLADGEYYELVRSNFERADRQRVVRTTTSDQTSIVGLLNYYNDLRFN
ncbi:unnamed protein product [Adineta steineri]|uniref:F-box domain-containing protein n=1 Tax=Adineta steineri TaxID=433720 RepID=A0A814DC32_9BILA|nr:unnamed protein product [Adineta steineri]CAF1327532.1 unnamed protein product [Adineta steineri]CAF3586093.1 unnamed protein product [Adineta steineri]CAF3620292.1 unnamed protein product [Adineta steineri]